MMNKQIDRKITLRVDARRDAPDLFIHPARSNQNSNTQ